MNRFRTIFYNDVLRFGVTLCFSVKFYNYTWLFKRNYFDGILIPLQNPQKKYIKNNGIYKDKDNCHFVPQSLPNLHVSFHYCLKRLTRSGEGRGLLTNFFLKKDSLSRKSDNSLLSYFDRKLN